ncbi:MAG TPA: hypothetical protein VJ975_06440 [Candidatus Limnocylindria bacterium]|nr:hypothetical protein [Candidatus Limnocylindria bacterium]
MKDRWRGRRAAGLAVVVLLGTLIAAAAASARDSGPWLVVRDDAGDELARMPLPASHELTLRYRNSIYHSLAEEHFRVSGDDLDLHALDAQELAVLEEYYGAFGATREDGDMGWSVQVERPPVALPLRIQATALGERTLIVDGRETSLWRLVAGRDDTVVILSVERGA